MPELPEVETVRQGLEKAIAGERITHVLLRRGGLRVPFPAGFAAQMEGRTILRIARRAKYLLFHLDRETVCLAHLGMSGRFLVYHAGEAPAYQKHDHAVFTFASGTSMLFHDPRRFGLITLTAARALGKHPLLARLGPDPFDKTFTVEYLREKLATRRASIKLVLMDQQVVAGLGNIYVCEALFAAGIDPRRSAEKEAVHAEALVVAIRKVLNAALRSGGSSLRDFFHADGEAGYFQHQFKVYGREGEPCHACGTNIRRIAQGGRSTFFCPGCQKC